MTQYEPIESKLWRNNQGRSASIYGALPYLSEAQRIAEDWRVVITGWTVRNLTDGTIGIGRLPWDTREQANEWISTHARVSSPAYKLASSAVARSEKAARRNVRN